MVQIRKKPFPTNIPYSIMKKDPLYPSVFSLPNFCIMRHGEYRVDGNETFLTKTSIKYLEEMTSALIESNETVDIKIVHSPLPRAVLTANVLSHYLKQHSVAVKLGRCKPLQNGARKLNLDLIIDEIDFVDEPEKTFFIFLTHAPEISYFLKQQGIDIDEDDINYCQLFSQTFDINGHQ